MRKLLVVAGIMTAAITTTLVQTVSAAGFSVEEIFRLPAHRVIDSRCPGVRTFADQAAKQTEGIVPQDAVVAAQQYIACYRLPRVNPDEANQRYLILSAAASLVLAAEKSNDENRPRLYRGADALAAQLSGREQASVEAGLDGQSVSGHMTNASDNRPMVRQAQPSTGPYAQVASEMQSDIEEQLVKAYRQTSAAPKANASP